jgi:hypothetical protein
MEEITREKLGEVLDALDSVDGISVTETGMTEYVRGDPTTGDSTPTGAEIEITAYLSLDAEPDEDNPFRVK